MNKICYLSEYGTLCIVHPMPKEDIEKVLGEMTDQEYRDHVYAVSIPPGATDVREINDNEIPGDRYFRNAWVDDGSITVDIEKAQVIHMDNLRLIRNDKLKELDVAYMQALESGDQELIQSIVTEKQQLRDMPENYPVTGITDLDELKNFKPEILL